MIKPRNRDVLGAALGFVCIPLGFLAGITACAPKAHLHLDTSNAYAIDGDTLKVMSSGQRLRLAGIDAPELPGHCRPGRACAPGNPYLAQQKLQSLLAASGGMDCTWSSADFYNRPLVRCYLNGLYNDRASDVSNILLAGGYAVRYPHD